MKTFVVRIFLLMGVVVAVAAAVILLLAKDLRGPSWCDEDACDTNQRCAIIHDRWPRCYTVCTKQSDCADGETCVSMDSLTPINALVNPKLNQTHFLCVRNP